MENMRSVKLTGIGQLEVIEEAKPAIKNSDDVLIQVDVIGICGSDVHYYNTGRIGNQVVEFPFTVGHEFAGTVTAVGDACTKVKPGDRVAVDPLVYCGTCDQCLNGRVHTCINQKFLGCPGQLEGCLKEFVVLPEFTCYPLPESIDQIQAALCEPLAIGCYAVSRADTITNKDIAIIGMGPIGLSVMNMAQAQQPGSICATDLLEYRCITAGTQGAEWAGIPGRDDCVFEISKRHPALMDTVFECCGKQEALDMALELVKPGGEIVIVGIPEFDQYHFTAHTARRKEVTIKHIRRQNEKESETLRMVASGSVDPTYMATHFFPLERVQEAFDLVASYGDGVIKAMVMLNDETAD